MVSVALIILAAMVYAFKSTLEFRFGWIRFKFVHWHENFWNPVISSQHSKTVFGYKIDGFHLMQSLFIVLILGAVVSAHDSTTPLYGLIKSPWISSAAHLVAYGLIWCGVFERIYQWIAPPPKSKPSN